MKPPPLRTVKFKTALVAAFVVVALGLMVVLLSADTYAKYRQLQIERCRSIVDFETERANSLIERLEANARALALIGELYYRDGGRHQTLVRVAVIKNFGINTIAVGGGIWYEPNTIDPDRERVCYYAYRTDDRVVIDENFAGDEYDYHRQKWYLSISEQVADGDETVAWSPTYFDELGTRSLMTTAGAAIRNDRGELVGISTVDWQLDAIVDAVSSIRPTDNSFILFADPLHDIVLAITDEKFAPSESDVSLSDIEWYGQVASGDGLREISYLGTDYLSFGSRLDNGMIFIVNVPEKELFEDIHEDSRQMTMLLVVSCAALAACVYFMLSRFVNAPLAYLSRKAEEIGEGDLDTEIKIDTGDEFSRLADVLGTMTRNIKNHIANLETVTAEKERITTELAIATEIQTSLLPTTFPPFPDREEFDILASMTPAREVGGDFYDFFMVDDDHVAVVIADVSGKGVPSALFMVVTRTLIRNYAALKLAPGEVFRLTNEQLCENNRTGMFVTAFMGVLDVRTGIMRCVNAGHNPPLLSRAGENFAFLKPKPGFVLGGLDGMKYEEMSLELRAGDRLFLYTDGVTEAENGDGELFGESRLADALNTAPPGLGGMLGAVSEALEGFARDVPQSDDITMLGLVFKTASTDTREITLPAVMENLPEVLRFISDTATLAKMPLKKMAQLETAAEEIYANIANYAYGDGEGTVSVRVSVEGTPPALSVRFQDEGAPFNPLEEEAPDLSLPAGERPIGGLGIYMARNLVDSLKYEYLDGKNTLTMTKNLKVTQEEEMSCNTDSR